MHLSLLRALGLVAALACAASACVPDQLSKERGPTPTRASRRPSGERARAPTASSPVPAGATRPGGHLALGVPRDADPSDDVLLVKPEYALSYNGGRNEANWVAWRLVGPDFGAVPRHKGKFLTDDTLPAGLYRVTHEDYVGSGYDRGHLCRSEDRTSSVEANRATFLMTNILPQRHELNAGPWLRLEELSQHLAQRQGKAMYVVAGGIYDGPVGSIGHGVAVPPSFFKVIVVLEPGQTAADVSVATRVIAVVMPNASEIEHEPWDRYRTSVDEIERRTGYDFLTAVPAAVQRVIEARVDDRPVR